MSSRASTLRISAYVIFGLLPALLLCGVSAPMLFGGLRLLAHGHVHESGQIVFFFAWPAACLLGTGASLLVVFGIGARSLAVRIVYTVLLLGGAVAGLSLGLLDPALILLTIGPVLTAMVLCIQLWRNPRDAGRTDGATQAAC